MLAAVNTSKDKANPSGRLDVIDLATRKVDSTHAILAVSRIRLPQHAMVGNAIGEATGKTKPEKRSKKDVSDRQVVVIGSGNLGLVYLMEEKRRLTLEEMKDRHPRLIPALCAHPHVGWVLARSSEHGATVLGADGVNYLEQGRVEGNDPLASFSPSAPQHLLRTDGFSNVADLMIGSFYDADLDEGCAFEELISFHGGIGGAQTRPFILAPVQLPKPETAIVGAAKVHEVLVGWRSLLQDGRIKRSLRLSKPSH